MSATTQELQAQIAQAIEQRGANETHVQVSLFWNDERESDTPEWAQVTTHAPGGYIARGGDHYDETVTVEEAQAAGFAEAIILRATEYAYENFAALD